MIEYYASLTAASNKAETGLAKLVKNTELRTQFGRLELILDSTKSPYIYGNRETIFIGYEAYISKRCKDSFE